jgi:hypothetical protein
MMLPVPRAVQVLDQPTMTRRATILEKLEPSRAARVLEGMAADERTDIVQQMGEHERRRLLPKLSAEVRAEMERLLQYPDHTAGGIMTTEFVRLEPSMTCRGPQAHPLGGAGEGVDLRVLRAGAGHRPAAGVPVTCATWSWPSWTGPSRRSCGASR